MEKNPPNKKHAIMGQSKKIVAYTTAGLNKITCHMETSSALLENL
jgi:hypothetical protein